MNSKKPSRRKFLASGAAVAGVAAGALRPASGQTPAPATAPAAAPAKKDIKELIAYGERSRFVTSIREPSEGRPSPDAFGLTFHVVTPLGESVGSITPSSLHYVAAHRGFFVPDIDPKEHRLMIHAMDDILVAWGQNGEPVRPQQGFPLRLVVPGFEGIYQTKYLRRIKVVDRYYMTYNDYGHLQKDPKVIALTTQLGPKSVITFPGG